MNDRIYPIVKDIMVTFVDHFSRMTETKLNSVWLHSVDPTFPQIVRQKMDIIITIHVHNAIAEQIRRFEQ